MQDAGLENLNFAIKVFKIAFSVLRGKATIMAHCGNRVKDKEISSLLKKKVVIDLKQLVESHVGEIAVIAMTFIQQNMSIKVFCSHLRGNYKVMISGGSVVLYYGMYFYKV